MSKVNIYGYDNETKHDRRLICDNEGALYIENSDLGLINDKLNSDSSGNLLVSFSESGLATESTLLNIESLTTTNETYLNNISTLTTSNNNLLQDVKANTDKGTLSIDNTTTTPLLTANTFTGTYEQNEYPDVMVSCKTDQPATLRFIFSNDGINDDVFPSVNFAVSAGIHEFHTAVKGPRYFKVELINDGSDQTYLRLYTYYGTFRQGNLPLNQPIGNDSDSIVVRSVLTGENPTGSYVNQKVDGYKIYTTTPLSGGSSYDSGIMDLDSYTQIETQLYADTSGTLVGYWYSDELGSNLIRTFTRPYTSLTLDYFSAPVFGRYLKYVYTNSGTPQTSFLLGFRNLTKSISGQLLGVEDFISSNMSVNLNRSIISGKTEAGAYINAGITNDGELFTNTKASNRQTRAIYNSGSITTDTYALLVDLSQETYNNYASIDNIGITCGLTANNSTCNIKIGVITRIDAVDADISYLLSVPFQTANANTFLSYINNYQPSSVKMETSGGSLVGAYTNDTQSAVALVNTALTLPSPRGNITPAEGDIIIYFDHTGTNFNSTINCIYHTD